MFQRLVRFSIVVLVVLGLAGVPTQAAHAYTRTCYVDADSAGGDGGTWATAYISLQTALADATCIEIWVAEGMYKPGTAQTARFLIQPGPDGRRLYGGFDGTETARSQRNPAAHLTILSGDIDNNDDVRPTGIGDTWAAITGANSYVVVAVSSQTASVTSTTILDGFTITGGQGPPSIPVPTYGGGGLLCYAYYTKPCNPTLSNLTFSGNKANKGGALFNYGHNSISSPTISNVTFRGNQATDGGAIYNSAYDYGGSSSPTLTNVTFVGNQAASAGGAIFNGGTWHGVSNPTLTNVTFTENSASYGGVMYSQGSSGGASNAVLKNVIVWGNTSPSSPQITAGADANTTISYSDIQGGCGGNGVTCGAGNINADPKLNALANYGGFTNTRTLQKGSPAIDTGTNTGCPARDQRGVTRPADGDGNATKICDMGATESRAGTLNFQSLASHDGWVLESGENSTIGGTMNSGAATFFVGDNPAKKQYRGILSFNTSSLPDGAAISKLQLKIKKLAVVGGGNPFSIFQGMLIDIKKGYLGSAAALQTSDFQATPGKAGLGPFNPTPSAGLYTITLPSTAYPYVNKLSTSGGLTQLRLRFKLDDNNNTVANYMSFYSGNAVSANRPVLAVTFYAP